VAGLSSGVLVLNKSWIAVQIATARRAISLIYQGLAKVIDVNDEYKTYNFESWCDLSAAETEEVIQAVNFKVKIPEIIVLTVFNDLPKREVVLSRKNIFERDKNTCQYCTKKLSREDLTIDHVIPRSRGGKNSWDNLVIACYACNARKKNRLPSEANMYPLKTPKKPRWIPHVGVQFSQVKRLSWEKFVNKAYWETELKE
jgi:5-methylcytosine-specific restriction endonuclease McrA